MQYRHTQGFAMLFAVIVIGVVTIVSYAVSQLAIKETALTLIGTNSQHAFYAANSGIECAIFGDTQLAIFPSFFLPEGSKSSQFRCANNSDFTVIPSSGDGTCTSNSTCTTTFNLTVDQSNACAIVTVIKKWNGSSLDTEILSRGYDRCSGSNRVERAIRVTY